MTTLTATTLTAADRLLRAVTTPGASLDDVYAPDATFDATVPGWRFAIHGPRVAHQYAEWFRHPAEIEELSRHSTPTGEVIEYTISWTEGGVPHAARHIHVLTIDRDADRVVSDHFWCGGRWPAPLLAEMGAAGHHG